MKKVDSDATVFIGIGNTSHAISARMLLISPMVQNIQILIIYKFQFFHLRIEIQLRFPALRNFLAYMPSFLTLIGIVMTKKI